jgi:prepilin-type N-terminal cleavage/methylation domain-containing protein
MVFSLLIASVTLFMRKRFGFTIVEIMVVIALVGLLTAIVVPHVLNSRNRASQRACLSNLRQIDQAIQLWAADTQSLPTDIVTHTNLVPYLRKLPTCPAVKNGNFNADYGLTFVEEPSYCKVNVSLASMPHSLTPGKVVSIAVGDSKAPVNENFPKPRKNKR